LRWPQGQRTCAVVIDRALSPMAAANITSGQSMAARQTPQMASVYDREYTDFERANMCKRSTARAAASNTRRATASTARPCSSRRGQKTRTGYQAIAPPDPLNNSYSLTGTWIPEKYFTYRSVQIFKILFQGFYSPKSHSPHGTACVTQLSWLLHFHPTQMCRVEIMCTSGGTIPEKHLRGASP